MQTCPPTEGKNLLACPVTSADVAAGSRGMPSRRAAGPDGLTYEMFKSLVEVPSLLEVMTEGISLLFTPDGLSDPRVTTSLKSAVTNFLAKPDKSDEELNLIQNLRPITLRVVFFKIFTVILKRRFTSSLERTGTIDEEQQGFRCKRSARRAAHSLQNILWDANREGKKIAVLSLDWQLFLALSVKRLSFLS